MMKSWCSVPYRGREREYWRGRKRSKREKDKTLFVIMRERDGYL